MSTDKRIHRSWFVHMLATRGHNSNLNGVWVEFNILREKRTFGSALGVQIPLPIPTLDEAGCFCIRKILSRIIWPPRNLQAWINSWANTSYSISGSEIFWYQQSTTKAARPLASPPARIRSSSPVRKPASQWTEQSTSLLVKHTISQSASLQSKDPANGSNSRLILPHHDHYRHQI